MNGAVETLWFDSWAWLVFLGAGLVLIIMELLLGIDTGLDLVFIGSAFVIGGLVTMFAQSWVWTAITGGVICLIYFGIGRRYINKHTAANLVKTNIDTIIGKIGFVRQEIAPGKDGLVKVGHEEWRARADTIIKEGDKITVTGVSGVTLDVKKTEGGNR